VTTDQYIALGGAISTLLGVIITWLVAKKTQSKKELTYRLRMDRLIPTKIADLGGDLVVKYRGEELPEPVLLTVDIVNTGNVPVENPPIEIKAVGATYVIPGYFETPPPGYEDLWSLERTDAESCAVQLTHINPGQTARARLLMDELPGTLPVLSCPMAGLQLKKQGAVQINTFALLLLDILSPSASTLIKTMRP
jgi:hypothetical protein